MAMPRARLIRDERSRRRSLDLFRSPVDDLDRGRYGSGDNSKQPFIITFAVIAFARSIRCSDSGRISNTVAGPGCKSLAMNNER